MSRVPANVDMVPPRPNKKTKDIFTHVYDVNDDMQGKIYTDWTGRFPVKSSRGNQCLIVLINMDSSYISMEPMKNRSLSEMVNSFGVIAF